MDFLSPCPIRTRFLRGGTQLHIAFQNFKQLLLILLDIIDILQRIFKLLLVLIWNKQCLDIICQPQAANPFATVRFVQDINIRLCVLICNVMDISSFA